MKTGCPMPPLLVCGLHTAEWAVAPYRFEENFLYQCQCAHAVSGDLKLYQYWWFENVVFSSWNPSMELVLPVRSLPVSRNFNGLQFPYTRRRQI
jgi:hypothetical protein